MSKLARYFTDRSRLEEGYKCPRKRYLGYHFLGKGLIRGGPPPIDLAYGLSFHDGADLILSGTNWRDAWNMMCEAHLRDQTQITVDGYTQWYEYGTLLYGHLRAFSEVFIPRLLDQYEVLAKEKEMQLPFTDDIIYGTRIDLALKDRSTGYVYNVEYKTDSSPSDIQQRMEYNLQFLLESATLSEWLGEPVMGTIIIGIDKGSKGRPSKYDISLGKTSGERRLSPLTYAYVKNGVEWSYEYKSGKGWERVPVWINPGVNDWWEVLTGELAFQPESLFTISPPILFDNERFERVRRQVIGIEDEIKDGLEVMRIRPDQDWIDVFFHQNFLNCKNDGGYRKICPFTPICHEGGYDLNKDLYQERKVNHPIEEDLIKTQMCDEKEHINGISNEEGNETTTRLRNQPHEGAVREGN